MTTSISSEALYIIPKKAIWKMSVEKRKIKRKIDIHESTKKSQNL